MDFSIVVSVLFFVAAFVIWVVLAFTPYGRRLRQQSERSAGSIGPGSSGESGDFGGSDGGGD